MESSSAENFNCLTGVVASALFQTLWVRGKHVTHNRWLICNRWCHLQRGATPSCLSGRLSRTMKQPNAFLQSVGADTFRSVFRRSVDWWGDTHSIPYVQTTSAIQQCQLTVQRHWCMHCYPVRQNQKRLIVFCSKVLWDKLRRQETQPLFSCKFLRSSKKNWISGDH